MKKATSLFLAGVLALLLFAGCSVQKEDYTQKTHTEDGSQIKKIVIDVLDREIEVSASSDNQIHIGYFESSKEYYDISVSDDQALTMKTVTDKTWADYFGQKPADEYRKISLKLPTELLKSMELKTTNEDIKISPLTVTENISLQSNGGNIIFEALNAGKSIILESKNGNINGTIDGTYDEYEISCKIKKGNSNLPPEKKSGEKTLQVNANNGDITIDFQ